MNRNTKKIKKLFRRKQNSKDENIDIDQVAAIEGSDEHSLEILTSCLANMQLSISQSKFLSIVTADVLRKLLNGLSHTNPQIVINSLYAFQNLFRISSLYENKIFDNLLDGLNLLGCIEKLQNQISSALDLMVQHETLPAVVEAYLAFMNEFYEVCQQSVLAQIENSQLLPQTFTLAIKLLNNPFSIEIYIDIINLFQVLSESIPTVNIMFTNQQELLNLLMVLFSGDFSGNKILQSSTFPFRQKLRSLLVVLLLNIIQNVPNCQILLEPYKQSLVNLITNVLTVNIFKEIENLKNLVISGNFISKGQKQIQPEEMETQNQANEDQELPNLDTDKKVKSALQIWLDTADTIVELLKFFARIYEGGDYDDMSEEEVEEEFENEPNQVERKGDEKIVALLGQFFEPQFQTQIVSLWLENFFRLSYFLEQSEFLKDIQGYKLTLYVQEASILIISASQGAIQNLIGVSQMDSQTLGQIVLATSTQLDRLLREPGIIDDQEDKSSLAEGYLKIFNAVLFDHQDLAVQLNEQSLVELARNLFSQNYNEDCQLQVIELLKKRYNSKITNNIQTISAITQLLVAMVQKSGYLVGAQALDCLFDIYTEEDYNSILKQQDMLSFLQKGYDSFKHILPTLKGKIKKEDFKFIRVTLTNLKDFIEYKRKIMG